MVEINENGTNEIEVYACRGCTSFSITVNGKSEIAALDPNQRVRLERNVRRLKKQPVLIGDNDPHPSGVRVSELVGLAGDSEA